MLEITARFALAGILVASSVAKLAGPASSRAALGTFGIVSPAMRRIAWGALIVTELSLAAGVAAGSTAAAYAAAAVMAVFALTLISAIMRGRAGAPCACFGSRSTVSWWSVGRNAALAAAFAALPALPQRALSTDEWLGLGLAVALIACAALAIAVLALAREVGMLRLRLGSGSALEVADEGPPLGERVELIGRFAMAGREEMAVAIFTSAGCHVCRTLAPAFASVAAEPVVELLELEESEESEAWEELEIPGSPYALVLDRAGTVIAKGTFNNLAQLESVLATAERRRAEGIGALGG